MSKITIPNRAKQNWLIDKSNLLKEKPIPVPSRGNIVIGGKTFGRSDNISKIKDEIGLIIDRYGKFEHKKYFHFYTKLSNPIKENDVIINYEISEDGKYATTPLDFGTHKGDPRVFQLKTPPISLYTQQKNLFMDLRKVESDAIK